MNTYQKVIAIFQYLNVLKEPESHINFDITSDNKYRNFSIYYCGHHCASLYNYIVDYIEITTTKSYGVIQLTMSTESDKIIIDNKVFSTKLSEEELFQFSLQYPVLDSLYRMRYDKRFIIEDKFVDLIYEELKL